ncbi:hypothetical protein PSTG_18318 [Puccinia striiformis f. sp. tritici PST-78]|uniref:Uncharacterized protein n=1 Tax=Puccinia striiformis f. sp. tritici PST-78 TaxID=1165861 RepID=A0A0L0UMI6_9BASI|nr:hypothetical protein PSTG_18318 [Puccinia striiformis f. sp. tritici PST-78]
MTPRKRDSPLGCGQDDRKPTATAETVLSFPDKSSVDSQRPRRNARINDEGVRVLDARTLPLCESDIPTEPINLESTSKHSPPVESDPGPVDLEETTATKKVSSGPKRTSEVGHNQKGHTRICDEGVRVNDTITLPRSASGRECGEDILVDLGTTSSQKQRAGTEENP